MTVKVAPPEENLNSKLEIAQKAQVCFKSFSNNEELLNWILYSLPSSAGLEFKI